MKAIKSISLGLEGYTECVVGKFAMKCGETLHSGDNKMMVSVRSKNSHSRLTITYQIIVDCVFFCNGFSIIFLLKEIIGNCKYGKTNSNYR